ncbi:gamma-glutamyl hydrolase-like isoform X1 [Macrobrachium rosenbergii]|uniref:gamma-glutamyl hydrolase-like isoform X1 n=1 Tax=Macrobrachium rosenbergii TaxID=79674 RepID=UPI0034D5F946
MPQPHHNPTPQIPFATSISSYLLLLGLLRVHSFRHQSLRDTVMGSSTVFHLVFLALAANALPAVDYNLRPIIGVLAQKAPESLLGHLKDKNYTSYIAASYVKFIEGSGGRVVPIFTNQDDSYYENIASSVNGILFPGGGVYFSNITGYGAAGQKLYELVVKANMEGTYMPLWGTCLGFLMIPYLATGYQTWWTNCNAWNKADPLTLQEGYMDSRIFEQMPGYVTDYARLLNTTVNFHSWCMTPENFTASGLSKDFKVLATSYDFDDLEYVALFEHNDLPIFGSQFHPEKNLYEWVSDEEHSAIPHDSPSVGVSQYFSSFFINQARYNKQGFATDEEEQAALLYNYGVTFTGAQGWPFTEAYFFR